MENKKILGLLAQIKERLYNLQTQRRRTPSSNRPMFPFVSSSDVLRKISDEEAYLLKEASKLKEKLSIGSGEFGKTSSSVEVESLFYLGV